jgi:DNA polymerase V
MGFWLDRYTVQMNSIEALAFPEPLAPASVRAGFPLPAEDLGEKPIDLSRVLITHPQATYLVRARGLSMREAGISDNDILVVNRALKPRHQHIVVAVVDGEFTVKTLYQWGGQVKLKAANPSYADIIPQEGQTLEIWGVVTAAIRQFVK